MNNEAPTVEVSGSKKKRSGLWSTLAYFAAVALVVFGIAWVTAPPDDGDVEASGTETTTTVPSVDVDAPVYLSGEEPIADAAEVILPSVVHIQTQAGLGSGVIYESSGLIVTAAHVVAGNDEVRVRLATGEQLTGAVIGAVADVDIAVIQVEADDLPAASFNREKPRVGQMAIAVGSPWGLESTVTAGIVSAVDQASCDPGGRCVSTVQTDAAINPGNSGGPLVDRHGEVIGINVSIFTESGANDGVGFAVPANTVMEYAESIVSGEPLQVAFLGVTGAAAVESGQAGALITLVTPASAAEEAGIKVDDVVISFDSAPIRGIDDLAAQVRLHRPGDTVEIVLLRDGEEMTVTATLGVRSEDLS